MISRNNCNSNINCDDNSSHTEEFVTTKQSVWMTIYMLPSWVLSTLAKELTAPTHITQSSPIELTVW